MGAKKGAPRPKLGALRRQLGRLEAKLEVKWPLFEGKMRSWARVHAKVYDMSKVKKKLCFFLFLKAQRGLGWPKLGPKWGTWGLGWLKLANIMGKMREDAKIMRAMLPKLGSGCRPRASWRPSSGEMMRWRCVEVRRGASR